MTDFEPRQLSATTDKARPSWSAHSPNGERMTAQILFFTSVKYDPCAAKARQQSESIRQYEASRALIEHAKAGEMGPAKGLELNSSFQDEPRRG